MSLFSGNDAAKIGAAIQAAERHTSGEIVCVVARAASDYAYIPIIWAALGALALPLPLLKWTVWSAEFVHLVQLLTFVVLVGVLWPWPIRLAVTPRIIKRQRARSEAREQFLAQSIVQTEWRTGVLIYVAEAEHYAEVIADSTIAACVDDTVWRETIETLTDALAAGRPVDGFTSAIAICGRVLAQHAPPRPHDRDELPNRLIML